ncbi:hypothetical protein V1264_012780 [Littorina saxatilis]|uniref:Reverse transcriptase domain-containing protein n=1 Tax=Littorina saxatilis TaxID=31220 RepID=A0AAN9GMN8_9CAEN
MQHLQKNNILTDVQHGFRKQRSCESQLIVTVHDIAQNLAKKNQVDTVLLDFSKAFDKVPHQRLQHKLHYYGVRGSTLNWIQSFLSDRTQRVAIEGVQSTPAPVTSGVPQGTVLGPLLFLLYINDMPDVVKNSKVKLFADDSLLFRNISNQQDQMLLQQDLEALEKWEQEWQMEFNPSKCVVMNIMPNKNKILLPSNYHLHGQTLETTTESKYLGVTITSNLSWGRHVETAAAKGNRTVGFLRRNFKECTPKVKAATYITMVRPTLEYASTVWNPHEQQHNNLLESVQKRAARYVHNNYREKEPGTVTNMLTNLGWKSLEERRHNSRLAMMFKIKNDMVGIDKTAFLKPSDTRTRGNRIHQEQDYHPSLSHSFFPRTTSEWNKLPISTTSAPSLESFMSRLGGSRALQPSTSLP